jgi:hypothetical protein
MVMSPAGLRPENGWRRPAAIVNDRPILSSDRMLHKDYNRWKIKILVVSLKELDNKTN